MARSKLHLRLDIQTVLLVGAVAAVRAGHGGVAQRVVCIDSVGEVLGPAENEILRAI